jgi:molybdopterin-guanine dinucleotide biosynthesis protein A
VGLKFYKADNFISQRMLIEQAENISGVILAGGQNKRFGGINKSNIVIGGLPVISRINNIVSEIFGEKIIVTNTPGEFQSFATYRIVADQFQKVGPLGGIHAAMKASSKGSVFIFAGDMPFLDKEIIMNQIRIFSLSAREAIIPRVDGHDEPLHAIYSNSIYNKLNDYLSGKNQYAVRDFLKNLNVCYMDLQPSDKTNRAFTNINTPAEAEAAAHLPEIDDRK